MQVPSTTTVSSTGLLGVGGSNQVQTCVVEMSKCPNVLCFVRYRSTVKCNVFHERGGLGCVDPLIPSTVVSVFHQRVVWSKFQWFMSSTILTKGV